MKEEKRENKKSSSLLEHQCLTPFTPILLNVIELDSIFLV